MVSIWPLCSACTTQLVHYGTQHVWILTQHGDPIVQLELGRHTGHTIHASKVHSAGIAQHGIASLFALGRRVVALPFMTANQRRSHFLAQRDPSFVRVCCTRRFECALTSKPAGKSAASSGSCDPASVIWPRLTTTTSPRDVWQLVSTLVRLDISVGRLASYY